MSFALFAGSWGAPEFLIAIVIILIAIIIVRIVIKPIRRKRTEKGNDQNIQLEHFKAQMEKWRAEGYDVSQLEAFFNDSVGTGDHQSNRAQIQRGRNLSFTRSDLDNVLRAHIYTPSKLIELLERDFKEEYSGDLGIKEKYPLKTHTLKVLGQFEKYFSQKDLPAGVDINFMRLILAMHDIGKPSTVRMGVPYQSRQFTMKSMSPVLKELGYSEQDINVASALVLGDPIGKYLKVKDMTIEDLRRSAEMIGIMAKETNLPISDFFNLLVIYYMVDASSYTRDAGSMKSLDYLFVFDPRRRKLQFAPPVARKIEDLRTFVLGRTGDA